jgi:hypothetical protein
MEWQDCECAVIVGIKEALQMRMGGEDVLAGLII